LKQRYSKSASGEADKVSSFIMGQHQIEFDASFPSGQNRRKNSL